MRFRDLFGIALICTATASAADHWVATWGASPSPQLADEAQMRAAHLMFSNQTLREIVRVSLGGSSVRVRFFQRTQPADGEYRRGAYRGADEGFRDRGKTDRALTFGGRPLAILPPDGVVISDPVNLSVAAGSDLTISLFIPGSAMAGGIHYGALQTSYIGEGDMAGKARSPIRRC